MNLIEFLFDPIIKSLNAIQKTVTSIEKKVDTMTAAFETAKQSWIAYAQELSAQRDAAVAALTDAQTTAQQAADALKAFQDDDAATDAQQLADQAQAFADELTSALESVQDAPEEPEPLPDPGNPSQAPEGEEPQVNPE